MSEITEYPELHPEEQALREELARLRASLTALLLQKDDLLMIQCRRIESAYLRRFGALELKVYESWCECLRAKRKAKLIRAKRNRREAAVPEQIEAELDEELQVYKEELETRFRRVSGVMEQREGPGLTPGGSRKLRELYRQAVKALHPDLNPGGEEADAQKLQQAMRAYRAGDLETLQAICETSSPAEAAPSSLEQMRTEAKRLRRSLREMDRQLEAIKAEYPYSMRVYLEDNEKGRARENELSEQLRDLHERKKRYEDEIERMLAPEEEL